VDYHQQYFEKQGGGSCAVTIEVPDTSSPQTATN
jgi:peptide methionine sulfoxide reductase MsrA